MKLVIFGATGRLGKNIVKQALENGHKVTAFVRNRSKIEESNQNLELFEGDVMDPESVKNAIQGQDAVISALGDGRKGKIRAAGTRAIVEAMAKTDTRRLISESTAGVGDSEGNLNFFWRYRKKH